jgi:nicotinate-nucleotide--dimethylbenzimidazole phosphoribosyltransferase
MQLLNQTRRAIPELDAQAMQTARARLETLTKPSGSLGRLESLVISLAGMRADARPHLAHKVVVVCAADHGIAESGVSAYPPQVTAQMLANFVRGGAAINVLARQIGAELRVANLGVRGPAVEALGLVHAKLGEGTRNFWHEPAMSRDDAVRSIEVGIGLAERADVLATGDMGIGNTTASAAVIAALTGAPAALAVGRGTGLDDAALRRKIEIVEQSLARRRPDPKDPLDVLSAVGGYEIGALAGVVLGAAARRIPVVLDGLASGAAALLATALEPRALAFCIAGHVSAEPAHRIALDHLGLVPLLDLGLRLGEGTGAALALPLLDAACRLLDEMATFAEASVSTRGSREPSDTGE